MVMIFMALQPSHRNVIRNLRKQSSQYNNEVKRGLWFGILFVSLFPRSLKLFSIISTGSAQHNEGNPNFSVQVFERAEILLRF